MNNLWCMNYSNVRTNTRFTVPLILPVFFFSLKMYAFYVCYTCFQVHFRLDFIMEANAMNPEQSDLGLYCLQYRLLIRPNKIPVLRVTDPTLVT